MNALLLSIYVLSGLVFRIAINRRMIRKLGDMDAKTRSWVEWNDRNRLLPWVNIVVVFLWPIIAGNMVYKFLKRL